jgi:hypothetical protein
MFLLSHPATEVFKSRVYMVLATLSSLGPAKSRYVLYAPNKAPFLRLEPMLLLYLNKSIYYS